jgi:hypothetical protein
MDDCRDIIQRDRCNRFRLSHAATRHQQCQIAQRIADLQDRLRHHSDTGAWQAIIDVSAELADLDPAAADTNGLVKKAREMLEPKPQPASGHRDIAAAERRGDEPEPSPLSMPPSQMEQPPAPPHGYRPRTAGTFAERVDEYLKARADEASKSQSGPSRPLTVSNNRLDKAPLICGIVAVFTSFLCIGIFPGAAAVVVGVCALRRGQANNRGGAFAGIMLGIVVSIPFIGYYWASS